MSLFKKRKIKKVQTEVNPYGSSEWWNKLKVLYKKDTGGVTDETDPEYDAQKIYKHWIHSYLSK